MKLLNGNVLKIVLAFVVIVGVIYWAADSARSRSYSGTNLTFDAAGELIKITNSSDNPIAAQFTGSGSRAFRVSSAIEGVGGSSTGVGTGSTRIYQFEFELPPGTSEFTISGGTDVRFVAETDTKLQATVNPMSSESRRSALITAAAVVFVALFYASNATRHQWIKSLRHNVLLSRQDTSNKTTTSVPMNGGQGRAARSYGDNRADTGDLPGAD